jgi:hypothetical protein
MNRESKSLEFEFKADTEGQFVATFATLNVIDSDQDVTLPGAFREGAEVLIGGYNHDERQLPYGSGAIAVEGDKARVEGELFIATTAGRDAYEVLSKTQKVMEWSYVYRPTEVSFGRFKTGSGAEVPVRFLKALDVWSVDPVMRGSGEGTRTDSIKSDAMSYADHAQRVLGEIAAFAERTSKRVDTRSADGRELSADDRDRGTALLDGLADLGSRLAEAFKAAPDESEIDLGTEYLRYQRTLAEVRGFLRVGGAGGD